MLHRLIESIETQTIKIHTIIMKNAMDIHESINASDMNVTNHLNQMFYSTNGAEGALQ